MLMTKRARCNGRTLEKSGRVQTASLRDGREQGYALLACFCKSESASRAGPMMEVGVSGD
jgi:hypothetical protein